MHIKKEENRPFKGTIQTKNNPKEAQTLDVLGKHFNKTLKYAERTKGIYVQRSKGN